MRELEDARLVYRNKQSRWLCPALPVAKPGTGTYRITIDYRPVNKMTVPLAGAAPNLAVVVEAVRGAYGLGTFDFHKGCWQTLLYPSCQEVFSFVTEDGVFTPTRVPQGASDPAVHFQSQMNDVLQEMLFRNVLVWIGDVLLYAKTPKSFMENLSTFFEILRQRNLKLHVKKCILFARRIKWCGKLIDGEGVQHDPEGKVFNMIRSDFQLSRGRLKSHLTGAKLLWSEDESKAFRLTLKMVSRSCKEAIVCMFSDVSLTGYSVVVTQVRRWDEKAPNEIQAHELLICRGGMFKNAQLNWPIVEKEGYPIVKACEDLVYMLKRAKGIRIYCGHSNLIQLLSLDKEVKQHVKGKLQRWILKNLNYRYVITHIPGEKNLGQTSSLVGDNRLSQI